jgi:Lrp/AsnC family leucine-responsive transcriptional regulator
MSDFQSKSGNIGPAGRPSKALDVTDWRIIEELQTDARLSFAELGRRVGLSSPAVQERVHKLEDAGVITGYRALIDPRKVGYPIMAIIRFGAAIDEQRLRDKLEHLPYVLDSYSVLGSDAYIARVAVPSIEVLWRIAEQFHDISVTTTAVVAEVVDENALISRNFGEKPPKSAE